MPETNPNDQSYSVDAFCEVEQISRSFLYNLWNRGEGPDHYMVGKLRRITPDMRRKWQQERQAATAGRAA